MKSGLKNTVLKTSVYLFAFIFFALALIFSISSFIPGAGGEFYALMISRIQPPKNIQPLQSWEDRMGTNGEKESLEWWYFDASLDDGTKLLVTFKINAYRNNPALYVDILWPDGTHYDNFFPVSQEDFYSSEEPLDVRIGKNTLMEKGSDNYVLCLEDPGSLKIDLNMQKIIALPRIFRKQYQNTADNAAYDVNWDVAVLKGQISGKIWKNGEEKAVSGYGYYDHVFGNMSEKTFTKYLSGWYWGRVWFNDYTVFFTKNYRRENFESPEKNSGQAFYIFKGDELIAEDFSKAEFLVKHTGNRPETDITISYGEENIWILLELERKNIIVSFSYNPANGEFFAYDTTPNNYSRVTGSGVLKINIDGKEETYQADPIWEFMEYGSEVSQ